MRIQPGHSTRQPTWPLMKIRRYKIDEGFWV
ncbi:hypothetical protein EDD73_11862 [Heliophilum fasciatum]|uniref:Uncharacterized protein n=1 Tax=Heliophilum fasciatum TaxID=35700 RepID=A0A4R2RLL7_9FIRM|nr:hypothetical protein [Heliophilum fasciatum]TCP63519.1 hypothetical protein EDD73_11862 [Heliophilum fasciatum]